MEVDCLKVRELECVPYHCTPFAVVELGVEKVYLSHVGPIVQQELLNVHRKIRMVQDVKLTFTVPVVQVTSLTALQQSLPPHILERRLQRPKRLIVIQVLQAQGLPHPAPLTSRVLPSPSLPPNRLQQPFQPENLSHKFAILLLSVP